MLNGQNVTVDVMIGSKCHCGRSELGRNVQAALRTSGHQLRYSILVLKFISLRLRIIAISLAQMLRLVLFILPHR